MQLTQTLHRAVLCEPDRIATIHRDRATTIGESARRIAKLAGALRALGVAEGDRVGILALNSDRYHEVLFAVPWAGAVINPVNVRWSATEIAYSLRDCGTDILFVDDAFVHLIPELTERAPSLRSVIYCGEGQAPGGLLDYEGLLSESTPADDARRGGADLFGIFYTGGTTGDPKGVMLSHRACLVSAMGSLVTTDLIGRGGVLLHAAPMFHLADIAAWNMGNLISVTHAIVPSFTPSDVIDAIESHRVTDALLVPTMIQGIVDAPEAAVADLSSLRRVLYGASPISETLLTKARRTVPNASFTQSYGMTELSPVATLLTPEDHNDPTLARSAGRPAAHVEMRIVDPYDNEVPRGEVGEIVVRGGHVMSGYWNKPQETEAALKGGWMHSGDAGYMDERGYVFVVDRIKDMIITGGENVYSVEVENAIAKHANVAQVAVIGVPDEQWGERVHAVVVTRPGADVTLEEIREFSRPMIAGYKLPRSLDVVSALPISAAGKVLKRELRDRAVGAGAKAAAHA